MCMKPKDALTVKKEHGGMVGVLFKATGKFVKLPLQKATTFNSSPVARRKGDVYMFLCL